LGRAKVFPSLLASNACCASVTSGFNPAMRKWILGTALLGLCSSLFAGDVTLAEEDGGLRVDVGGEVFTRYVIKGSQRPHLYPVIGPSGAGLTRTLPFTDQDDHPHHSSIWVGHGKVNDIDFWLDGEDNGRIEHTGFSDMVQAGGTASFTAKSRWITPDGDELMSDERRISITASEGGGRIIDLAITFTATGYDVLFEDTKEGTVAIRVAPVLSIREGKGQILTSAGVKNKKAWGTKAEWVSYFGADPKGEQVSITMMDHPANLRHPTTWHARDYGLLAANPFGLHDFERIDDKTKGNHKLAKGTSMTQRHRIVIEAGEPQQEKLRQSFVEFSQSAR